MNSMLILHIIAIPLIFYLGRLSTKIAFVRVRVKNRLDVSDFIRGKE
ncbi:hypothetical protein DNHGIG_19250 [Collibacillus ludicampi]|jgi:hypothetical protein|uniref:Uncharacterized protein n=1 Tax=Collibacillus ludicampi TaxID=2771369 RepID=A0AAV4LF62_9BACL|nr:hypothetical protein [Collibacillus ludicampi]GIM46376.1 hypothetical protein DNHGIG_19250 [Collibacillus ludicampi]